ncbi:hypothetical protein [Nocardia salmonicida]|uniref:hypothetical protein n=1 Tax=Nocardia salmonicida TaxID=53431 RepID=UPI00379973D3
MTTVSDIDPFENLFEPPVIVVPVPISGNGMAAIRQWVVAVERHFGGQGLATCHYATLIGYWANLKTFRVESSDRQLANEIDAHRDRLAGHMQRLVDAGFVMKKPKKQREKGTLYVLSTPEQVQL